MTILTTREREIIALLAQGRTQVEIASELCISITTVKQHTQNARQKTGCRNSTELAVKMMVARTGTA